FFFFFFFQAEDGIRDFHVTGVQTCALPIFLALILHETRQPPAYYFPREDVQMALLEKTSQVTHCPFRGNATYWTLRAGGTVAENAAWSYDEPYAEGAPIKAHVSFHPERVSAIYEGDDEIPH